MRDAFRRRPETLLFLVALLVLNFPLWSGACAGALVFQPDAVATGQCWRLFTHPFIHVTWYHLLLDGAVFLILYHSLLEKKLVRRMAYLAASVAGSVLAAWLAYPAISNAGLCGLSGIAHGLTAISALEMMLFFPAGSAEWRIGLISFLLVAGKATLEALTGHMFLTFLHFGLMGEPVAVSHGGGVLGALAGWLIFQFRRTR